jgi:hypothetical protein
VLSDEAGQNWQTYKINKKSDFLLSVENLLLQKQNILKFKGGNVVTKVFIWGRLGILSMRTRNEDLWRFVQFKKLS